jgi:hypothetical protein
MGWEIDAWAGGLLPAASLLLLIAAAVWCQAKG